MCRARGLLLPRLAHLGYGIQIPGRILTLVDGCWKALEKNTTVRTVNDLYTVGKTDLEHAQTFIIV